MAENKMAEVAALFGKQLNERFMIVKGNEKFDASFISVGLNIHCKYENPYICLEPFVLEDLLTGRAEIESDEK